MTFDRNLLPDPITYFENQGLILKGSRSAKWKTTACNFHGGSDSMRVKSATGAWRCMNCGESGGDVLTYEIKAYGKEFVQAAKDIGCWINGILLIATFCIVNCNSASSSRISS